ncbi:MAG: carbamoyltransferase N-terminal domain-containing protein, partial [Verrucomicrobiota bacterium]
MKILGISAFFHDSAAALIDDGKIVAAAQEERFTRKKHDARFPTSAIQYCLSEAACDLNQIDFVVFYEKPFVKLDRLLETYLGFAPFGFRSFHKAIPIWIKEKLFMKREIFSGLKKAAAGERFTGKLVFTKHHESHAASAFFASPFDEAAIVTVDGVGEWTTTAIGSGSGN